MSLLPNNSSLKDQGFAQLFDSKSRVDYSDLKIDVMSCDKSILPHVALMIGANIDNMLELEARRYLNTFTKKAVGTVGAVEDAISSTLDNAELVEWYQDEERLPVGFFGVTVQVQNDESIKYDERLFSTSKRVIKENKNVRSKLDGILLKLSKGLEVEVAGAGALSTKLSNELNLDYQSHGSIGFAVANVINTRLNNDFIQDEKTIEINTAGGGIIDVKLSSEIGINYPLTDIKIQGAGIWTI